ncbi:MAG: orotate phosphoribosyltransferase [Deltaproteobacteria bacterium]|nr:orotate phosphoribosyltransferase [Deltaproteobacteria bacterium]
MGDRDARPALSCLSRLSTQYARLLELLRSKAFAEREVTLSSGKKSNFYIDCKQVSLDAEGACLIGELFHAVIGEVAPNAVAVGGLTLGADPLATATSVLSFQQTSRKPLAAFLVRKEPKGHGTNQYLEHAGLAPGAEVVIVEDVVTTGAATIKALERAKEFGLVPVHALALVDRMEGGREAIAAAFPNTPLTTLYARTNFL